MEINLADLYFLLEEETTFGIRKCTEYLKYVDPDDLRLTPKERKKRLKIGGR